MPRLLNDWISSYLDFTKDTEPPISYHTWAAVSVIASTLQRRCFLQWGHHPIFPNMYIAIIGPSGQTRKGETLSLARPFLEHVGIPIVANRVTNERLFRYVGETLSNFKSPSGQIMTQCAATIWSPEMHVFLGKGNIDLLSALTDWYDCAQRWEYDTKHQGKDEIVGLCINMLAATAPDWLSSIFPQEAIGGGFTSRSIIVYEGRKGKIVADPNSPEYAPNKALESKLKQDLEQIKLLTGEFVMSSDALEIYKQWYTNQEEKIKRGSFPVMDPKFMGYCARRATHVKKLAMAISASRSDSLIVELQDFEKAVKLLRLAESKMRRAFGGVGRARFADVTEGVLDYIQNRRSVLRSELLRQFYRDVDAYTMDQIERVLERMKVVRVTHLVNEDDARYTYVSQEKEDGES